MIHTENCISGDDGYVAPPVPIPNTVVKHINAESTWLETAWEDRKLPVRKRLSKDNLFFVTLCTLFIRREGRCGMYPKKTLSAASLLSECERKRSRSLEA